MSYGELVLPPSRTFTNSKTGRFQKGHVPFNKGKKWSEYMGKRAMKRAAKGWSNVISHRPKSRPDTSGRCRKQVIAVMDDGRWFHFAYIGDAAKWVGGSRENVGRCCRCNHEKKVCKHNWRSGQKKGASLINTDHKYKGVRFYFESDNIWTEKIKN